MKKSLKKLLAGILTAAMIVGTMGLTAWASEEQPEQGAATMLSNYEGTPYTTVTTVGNTTPIILQVTGLNSEYERVPLTEEQAKGVTWSARYPNAESEKISVTGLTPYDTGDGYVARAGVRVNNTSTYCYAIIEAYSADLGSLDLAVVVNPQTNTVSGIDVNIQYSQSADPITYSDLTVGGGYFTGIEAAYPNPLIGTMTLSGIYPDGYNPKDPNGIRVEGVSLGAGDNSGTVASMTINGTTYPDNSEGGYWLYSVTKAGETDPDEFSDDVGAGVYELESGDTITWTYYTE